MNPAPVQVDAWLVARAHRLYCQLTGQNLSLRFDRERQWFELLKGGFGLDEIGRVIIYLQREIRHGRRNVGSLKLSNLLQPDRFEEDLAISRVLLQAPAPPVQAKPPKPPPTPMDEKARLRALELLRQCRQSIR